MLTHHHSHIHINTHTHTHTHWHTCKHQQARTMIFDSLKRGRACSMYYRHLWDTLCVKLRTHNLCMTFQRWTGDQTLCMLFSLFFSSTYPYMQEYAICNRLHVSTNRGPSSFAMLSSVWWWSVGVCPRLTVLTHTHTHTYTNSHNHPYMWDLKSIDKNGIWILLH